MWRFRNMLVERVKIVIILYRLSKQIRKMWKNISWNIKKAGGGFMTHQYQGFQEKQ